MLTLKTTVSCFTLLCLSVSAYADRGSAAFAQGARAERNGDLDTACQSYEEASHAVPKNAKYLAAYTRVKFDAAAKHVHNGEVLRVGGQLDQALRQFQQALAIDSTSSIALQELQQTEEMMRKHQQHTALKPAPVTSLLADYGRTVELKPLSQAPLTLHLTTNADMAYRTICKLAGINVVIDPDFRPQKLSLDLNDVTLEQALNLTGLESKSFWRPVLANTIVVAADSAAKHKELEQNVVRTFYLRNVSTPAELQDAANMVKQILDISHVQLLQGQDAMILRGTPDQLVLAEKLLADIDKPKSEVIIDISVMQVSRDRLRQLGTNVPTSASVGIGPKRLITGISNTSGSGGAGGSSSNGGSSSANTGFTFGNFSFSIPGASLTALASDNNTKILQSPQIRALNDGKATLRIGDRVPIATGSFSPGIVGAGSVSSLISTQFTYLDVGVNIDITPHVHSDDEVTLKMSLEISSVTGSANIGGISQPTIGQRRIELESRVTDGEVNLLGGILEDSETKSLSGYPWLSKLPLLKYLFAQENKDRTENEIVFAITPHIVRALDVNEANLRSIRIGMGSNVDLQHNEPAVRPGPNSSEAPESKKDDPSPPKTTPAGPTPPTQKGTAGVPPPQ